MRRIPFIVGSALLSACAGSTIVNGEPDRVSSVATSGPDASAQQSPPAAATSSASASMAANAGASSSGTMGSGGKDAPVALAGNCAAKTGRAGDFMQQIDVQGSSRSFLLHVPASYDPTRFAPLVLTFHGSASDADGAAYVSQMTRSSDARGFIVAYPNGANADWNCCNNGRTDDVAFVDALIERVSADYCVEANHVFAAGFSNGGYMAYRLMCELSSRIAAIAAIEGALAIEPCQPSRPIPVIQFHGTDDQPVPYAEAVQANLRARELNTCTAESRNVYARGDASCELWSTCAQGSAVQLCTIEGGGHQWPGGGEIDGLGHFSRDIDATEVIADFFAAH